MSLPSVPVLDDPGRPVVVAAFDGWADAGQAATAAVEFLAESGTSEVLGQLDVDDYYDYQVHRPHVSATGAGVRIAWPGVRLTRTVVAGRELLLLQGPEPSLRWRSFADALLGLVMPHDPAALIVLGAHLAPTPHTRAVPVEAATANPGLRARGLGGRDYEGPVGVGAVLHHAADDAGLASVMVWALVPDYRAADPHLAASLALVDVVTGLLGIDVPTDAFADAVAAERAESDADAAADHHLAAYVAELEQRHDAEEQGAGLASQVERFLRGL